MPVALLTFMNHYSRTANQFRQAVDSSMHQSLIRSRVIPQAQRFAQLRGQDPEVFAVRRRLSGVAQDSRYQALPLQPATTKRNP